MLTRVYTGSWITALSVALTLFLTGNMTMLAWAVFGFAGFGLVFMGMMCVLPTTVVHPAPAKVNKTTATDAAQGLRGRIRDYKETLSAETLAVRKPKFP